MVGALQCWPLGMSERRKTHWRFRLDKDLMRFCFELVPWHPGKHRLARSLAGRSDLPCWQFICESIWPTHNSNYCVYFVDVDVVDYSMVSQIMPPPSWWEHWHDQVQLWKMPRCSATWKVKTTLSRWSYSRKFTPQLFKRFWIPLDSSLVHRIRQKTLASFSHDEIFNIHDQHVQHQQ